MKKVFLVLSLFIITVIPCFPQTPVKEDPYQFVSDYIRAMSYYEQGMALGKEEAGKDETPDVGKIVSMLQSQNEYLEKAKSELTPYLSGGDTWIASFVAPLMVENIDKGIQANNKLIEFTNKLSANTDYNDENSELGNEDVDIEQEMGKAVSGVRSAAKTVPSVLYNSKKEGQSDVIVFTVTKAQRTSLLKQIKASFGNKVDYYVKQLLAGKDDDFTEGQEAAVFGVATVRDILSSTTYAEWHKRLGKYKSKHE